MKFGFWRRQPRQLADGESAVDGAAGVMAARVAANATEPAAELAALQQAVERTLEQALTQAAEGEHELLRRAAQQQHIETVPAAFYRAPVE